MFASPVEPFSKLSSSVGRATSYVFLSMVYWILLPVIAIPLKLLRYPLGLRKVAPISWKKRRLLNDYHEVMTRQY